MKTLKIISTFILFYSCNETNTPDIKTTTNGKTWKIPLENNLGILQIVLPKKLDTLFSWTQYSDCGDPCAKVDYRIQPKSLPVFKESGFYYFELKDSVEQFTIKHSKVAHPMPITDTSIIKLYRGKLKSEAFENQDDKYVIDTLIALDRQKFAVIAFKTFDSTNKAAIQILNAVTVIQGNILEFFFEYRKSYRDTLQNDFIKYSFNALKTIRISNVITLQTLEDSTKK